jgi:BNR repeat-like domain
MPPVMVSAAFFVTSNRIPRGDSSGSLFMTQELVAQKPGGVFRASALSAASIALLTLALAGCSGSSSSSFMSNPPPPVNPVGANLTQISTDPFASATEQHATEVEPHVFANGNTLVATYQTGRNPGQGGGSTAIGWATSTDGGTTWTHGFLPGLTAGNTPPGPYDRASDPNVAYDALHKVWLISSLPISDTAATPAVVVSRSTDGGMTWQSPVSVDTASQSSDKNWIVCDSTATSPHFGNCYVEWDDPATNDGILMSTSSDGGQTWGSAVATASGALGIGGQPLVQPGGKVVVPIEELVFSGGNFTSASISAFVSSDGGAHWSAPVTISGASGIQAHLDAGGIRSGPLPSAAIDGAGNIWVVWEDCRFRASCTTNDLVYSTSADGVSWSAVTRIPIDAVTSTADYFIPGIGIDPATSGAGAHVAIHYYYYSQTNCAVSTCHLNVGFISSANGGSTWNTPTTLLQGPMQLSWLPNSQNGLMVGDYVATAFTNGVPHGVFAVATVNSGTTFSEAIYTAQGLTVTAAGRQLSSANDRPLHRLSDKIENEKPEKGVIPPRRKKAR